MTEIATLRLDEARTIYEQVKAWGRWGQDDERGALNLITPAKRRQAAHLVQHGVSISAELPLAKAGATDSPYPVMHFMLRAGDVEGIGNAADYFAIAPHGGGHTHLDALCHFFDNGYIFNGLPQTSVTSMGATAYTIEAGADGIVSRGVLLDIPRAQGRDWLEPGEPVLPVDLDKAEAAAGLRVEEGDILLVRTGRLRRAREVGHWNSRELLAGLHVSCLPWLAERNIALLGCDGISDVLPSGVDGVREPVHIGTLVYMGVHLIDHADLEPLAAACVQYGRWEFLFAVCPLRLPQGTASPVNPIAMF
jgi:kynurenine formamidase